MVNLSITFCTHHISTSFKRAGLSQGDLNAWIVDLSGQATDEMYTSHAERMGFEIRDERANLEIFDSVRMGIEGEKSENGAIGTSTLQTCARIRKCERAPPVPGSHGGYY